MRDNLDLDQWVSEESDGSGWGLALAGLSVILFWTFVFALLGWLVFDAWGL